jgi:hypothetical protein
MLLARSSFGATTPDSGLACRHEQEIGSSWILLTVIVDVAIAAS